MALQFVPGNSGAGKSFQLYQKILQEAGTHPERKYLVIVPEQFTMQTQKELVALSPHHGIMNVDILSFDRLAHRVFAEVGGDQTPVLEDVGKILVLERVVQEQKKKLGVLGSSLEKLGTVSEMKSLLSELMQYDIHPEELDEIGNMAKEKPLLYHKLKDVQAIYQGFSEFLRKRYITAEEVLDLLCEKIGSSRLVRDSWIALDGFTGFTPVQNKLLRELLKLAQQVWVTVTLEEKVSVAQLKRPQHLFRMSGEMMESLTRMAAEERVEVLDPWWVRPGEYSRFCKAPALEFLEQHLFRYDKRQYRKEQEEVQIFQAANPKEEMEEIARRIRLLVRTKGYRYGDFAVITGDMATYGSYARQVMEQCEIPCFIDEKHSILMNPFVEYIRAAVNLVVEYFSYESMFRYLRCGLSGIPVYQVDQLENYCIAVGIRGEKQWKDHWVRRYRGMEEGSIEGINQIREQVWEKIGPFAEYMKEKEHTVEERTRMLYEMIVKDDIQERLSEKKQEFATQGDQAMVKEYSQIYGMIMELLDKMVQMLGSETITTKEYGQLLDVGFQEMRVGIIPPTADQVLIGEMERTRLKDIKVLFFAGVNDGIIPKHGGKAGLLSESDREFLDSRQVALAPTARESMYIQRFYLYLNLTKPSRCLYLSYAQSNAQGQAQSPAYLIALILRMYPKLVIQDNPKDEISQMQMAQQATEILLAGLRKDGEQQQNDGWRELFSWYLRSKEWKEQCLRWIQAAYEGAPESSIGKAAAVALYGKELENSATELERFAACAFAHFLQYGLKIEERQEYEFRQADLGNVIHQALEQFSRNLKKNQLTWRSLTDQERDQLIDTSVEESIHDYGNTILESSARNQYMILRVKRILRRTVWALQQQLKAGKYAPSRFEISFSMEEDLKASNFQLSEDERLRLRGRIDRVDRYEEDDTIYVKVIDYKSGNTALDLTSVYHGLQLQLIVYLNAALELEEKNHPGKHAEPAGMFYYHVKDPLVDGKPGDEEEEIERKLLEKLKVDGLVRAEEKILKDLDRELEAGKKSLVIPAAYNKNGSLSSRSKTASKEQFEELCTYVNDKIRENGTRILGGDMEKNPYKLKQRTACDYCSFKEICGFDEKQEGNSFRRLPTFSDEELWKKMREKGEKEDGNEVDTGTAEGH